MTLDADEASGTASILRSLLYDTENWQLVEATGLRRGPSYILALSDGRSRMGVELKRAAEDVLIDGEVVLETPSLTTTQAQAIAAAANASAPLQLSADDSSSGLRELETLIEPMLGAMHGSTSTSTHTDVGTSSGAPIATARIEDQMNEGAKVVPWQPDARKAANRRRGATAITDGSAGPLDELAALCDRVEGLEARRASTASHAPPSSPSATSSSERWRHDIEIASVSEAAEILTDLGAKVVFPPPPGTPADWAGLAGMDEVRIQVEEALVLPMRHPQALAAITLGTREESTAPLPARPAALLFHGPPGTGKTSAARLAAHEARLPLVYTPLETLVSKWLGEGERQLAKVFEASHALGPSILFVDELDALAGSREAGESMHEATRRMLSVLLRRMDGLDASDQTAIIGATNRRADLDPALLSRFDVQVHFPPPDEAARRGIFRRYAKHLPPPELQRLARAADGLSGREILDVCRQVERRWAAILLRQGHAAGEHVSLPPIEQYEGAVERRRSGP